MSTVYSPTLTSWQSAARNGPRVVNQDFEGSTEITSFVDPMIVLASSYTPLALSTATSFGGVSFYHTKDSGFSTEGNALKFSREYARIPTERNEWTDLAKEFPGYDYVWGVQDYVAPKNETTRAKRTFRYYVEGVTVTSAADIPISAPFQVTLSGTGYPVNVLVPSGFTPATTPTAEDYRAYVASGTLLVESDNIRRWKGGIYERETVEFIPR